MKIILIQGDNQPAISARLNLFIDTAKQRDWEVARLENKEQSLRELIITQNLFQKERLIVIDSASLISEKDKKWLKENFKEYAGTLVIQHSGKFSKSEIAKFPVIDKTENYQLPIYLWNFLDSIFPGNSRNTLRLFHKVLETEPAEFVFTLIAKYIRDLYWISVDPQGIPYPSWRKDKLRKQQTKFKADSLAAILDDLGKMDIKSKTSNEKLVDMLDFMFATRLQ